MGHRLDHVEDAADLGALGLELVHGFAGVADFLGQALDLGDDFGNHPVAFARLLVGHHRRLGGFLGIARDFMHGGGHFVHGRGDLVGLDFLAVDPGAGLLGNGRQFFGGAGDLRHAVADAANQLAQAHGHALHAALQLAQFVLALDMQVVTQVAAGDAVHGGQGLAQWHDDLPGDRPRGDDAEQQGQDRGQGQSRLGALRLGVADPGLRCGQLHAQVEQPGALLAHLVQSLIAGFLGTAELHHGGAVGSQGLGGGAQAGIVFSRDFAGQRLEQGQRLVDGGQGGLLELDLGAVGVATHLEARLLQQTRHFHGVVEDHRVTIAQQRLLDPGDQCRGLVGVAAQLLAGGFTGVGSGFQGGEGALVFAYRVGLLLQAPAVVGFADALAHLLQHLAQRGQGFLDLSGGGGVTVVFVGLAGDAQYLGRLIHLGDLAELVAAADHATQSQPAGQGDHQRQQQHHTEADAKFEIDAHISQVQGDPTVHGVTPLVRSGRFILVSLHRRGVTKL